jgi:hypothetical protein
MASADLVARNRKMRRSCSPTERRCCGTRIIPGVVLCRGQPRGVQWVEVADVECIQDADTPGGKEQLLLVAASDQIFLDRRKSGDFPLS